MSFDFTSLKWIVAADNPFGIRYLDVRDFCWQAQSMVKEPHLAEKFLSLRRSTGEQYRGNPTANNTRIPCELTYVSKRLILTPSSAGPIRLAEAMEDKWDIFLHDGSLLFVRSWTGQLIYKAKVMIEEQSATISEVVTDPEFAHDENEFALSEVDFLVKSHLCGLLMPHRISGGILESNKELIALDAFSRHGRWASFATFASTIALKLE
jgi:hypothetical protein